MNLREAAELAIEALQSARSVFNGEGDEIGGCGWCHAPSYGPCEPHCDKDRAVKALRAALAEDAMQRLTDVQQEMDCYGDGNVYRGQRSSDSKTPTLTINGMPAVEGPLSKAHRTCQESRQVEPVAYMCSDESMDTPEQKMLRRKWFGGRLYGHLPFLEAVDKTMKKLYDQLDELKGAWKMLKEPDVPETNFGNITQTFDSKESDQGDGMNLREAAQQALEALQIWQDSLTDPSAIPGWRFAVVGEKAVAALRTALAEDRPAETGETKEQEMLRRKWFGGRDNGHLSFVEAVDATMMKLHEELDRLAGTWKMADNHIADANKMEATSQESRQVEPVATVNSESGNPTITMSWWHEPALPVGTKLYAAPPQRTPLTDEEMWEVIGSLADTRLAGPLEKLIRATERAHGIGGEE